jgi:tRNA:m4X modification enzyme
MNELTNQKHAIQQSSLISHLNENGLLSSNLNYMEFGCGRAELSRYTLKSIIHQDSKAADFFLIDRSPCRMKLDGKMIKDAEDSNLETKVFRVKMDIKDLNADYVISNEFQNDKKFVAISKHLCGAATDLTIQCILKNQLLKESFQGMIVAMCCRHCCDYSKLDDHSKEYLTQREITQAGFQHLMKFASWAVNGRRPDMKDEDGSDHPSGLSLGERETLGLKARRIIDESRKYALERNGFTAKLCQYVRPEVSLENTCLIVSKT